MTKLTLIVLLVLCLLAAASAIADTPPGAPVLASAPADAKRPPQKITTLQAAILGVVEGVTEYLPVSSTGHLILAGDRMGLVHYTDRNGPFGPMIDKEKGKAIDSFDIVIQLGAILAVLGLYRKRVGQMASGLAGKNPPGARLLGLLLLAFLPAAIVGFLFHKKIEQHLFGPVPVLIALAVGGVLMIVVEYFFWQRNRSRPRTTQIDRMQYRQALMIGLAQCLAMWPGTSRSMITMLAALVVGLDMVAAAEFSFLLALPTLGAATLYSAYKDWGALMDSTGPAGLLVGTVVSALVAAVAVKAFVKWLTSHGMMPFGVYRIVLAIVYAMALLA